MVLEEFSWGSALLQATSPSEHHGTLLFEHEAKLGMQRRWIGACQALISCERHGCVEALTESPDEQCRKQRCHSWQFAGVSQERAGTMVRLEMTCRFAELETRCKNT